MTYLTRSTIDPKAANEDARASYASVNGLNLYKED